MKRFLLFGFTVIVTYACTVRQYFDSRFSVKWFGHVRRITSDLKKVEKGQTQKSLIILGMS